MKIKAAPQNAMCGFFYFRLKFNGGKNDRKGNTGKIT